MHTSSPLVSVCIPTWNGGLYVKRSVESVLSQTYPNIEIIVSDDASRDDTLAVIESMSDARFTIIAHENPIGAERNWNESWKSTSGRYVKLLCQDDVLMPQCIERHVEALEARPDATFCWSPRSIISPRGRTLQRSRGFKPATPTVTFDDMLKRIVRSGTNPFGEPCAVLMRRSSLVQTGGFTGQYLIDLNMWVALLSLGPAVFVDQTLSAFRVSNTSWTASLRRFHSQQTAAFFGSLADANAATVDRRDLRRGISRASRLEMQRSILLSALRVLKL